MHGCLEVQISKYMVLFQCVDSACLDVCVCAVFLSFLFLDRYDF